MNTLRQNRQELKKGIRKLDFFEGRGYIFVIRMKDGIWEMLPTEPGKEGVSAYSHKDENGKTPLFELKKQVEANPDGCFVEYKWKNPVSGKIEQKKGLIKSEVRRVKEYIDTERKNALKDTKEK